MVKGSLFVISAPSGGGKTSLVNALINQLPNMKISISHTTRLPRVGEVEGKNYFFVDEATFMQYKTQGKFLEYANVFNHWYGTSKNWVVSQLEAGMDVILEIDWQGALRIKEQMDCVSIFILPPSKEALRQRLQSRNQDSSEVISQRMAKAGSEISHYPEYDYLIFNENFANALEDLTAIVRAYQLITVRQAQRYATVLSAF